MIIIQEMICIIVLNGKRITVDNFDGTIYVHHEIWDDSVEEGDLVVKKSLMPGTLKGLSITDNE